MIETIMGSELFELELPVHCKHDEMVPLDKLKPNPDNPQVHPDDQVEDIGAALKANGWREPIVVSRRSGYIVKGHGRLQTARAVGLKFAPVEYQDYMDEEAELRDLIADNRVASKGWTDAFALGKLFRKMSEKARATLGYSQEEIGLFMAAEFVPAAPTDRKFQVLETLKMTKEAKAIVTHAVQRYCLTLGREMDWGEALSQICMAWETGGVAGPLPELPKPPEPAPRPKARKSEVAKGPIQPPAPGELIPPVDEVRKFLVKSVAVTELAGKQVTVVRQVSGEDKFYTDSAEMAQAARDARDCDPQYKVEGVVGKLGGNYWLKSLRRANV